MHRIFLFFCLLILSCAPSKKQIYVPPGPKKIKLSVSLELLKKRAERISDFLKKEEISPQKKAKLKEILEIYELIISKGGYIEEDKKEELIKRLLQIVFSLEEDYMKTPDIKGLVERISKRKKYIYSLYKSGRYLDVVNQCLELKLKYGPHILDPSLRIVFTLSLAKMGMMNEALSEAEKLIKENLPDISLLKEKFQMWKQEEVRKEKFGLEMLIRTVNDLIEKEEYEKALEMIRSANVKNKELEELKEKAEEGIINRERNKAARFFLLAKQSSDPEKKRQYLESAYRILKALILEYPDYPFIERIRDNLRKVEEELKSIQKH